MSPPPHERGNQALQLLSLCFSVPAIFSVHINVGLIHSNAPFESRCGRCTYNRIPRYLTSETSCMMVQDTSSPQPQMTSRWRNRIYKTKPDVQDRPSFLASHLKSALYSPICYFIPFAASFPSSVRPCNQMPTSQYRRLSCTSPLHPCRRLRYGVSRWS